MNSVNHRRLSEAGNLVLAVFPGLAHDTASSLLGNILNSLFDPFDQSGGSFFLFSFGVGFEAVFEGVELGKLGVRGLQRGGSEEVDVACERPSLRVDDIFNSLKEVSCQARDQLFLGALSIAATHFLHMLQAHVAALLVDGHESLFLGLGIWVSRLAVLFCAAKHV